MKYNPLESTGSEYRRIILESTDRFRYNQYGSYTPERIRRIMMAADSGDTEQLCLCAREILERNWDIIGALEQRSDALLGVELDISPGGERDVDVLAAKEFKKQLFNAGDLGELDNFYDLLTHFARAAVFPFAAAEIVWNPGGSLRGFQVLDAHHFTLRDSYTPLLITDEFPGGMPADLMRDRLIFHQMRKKSDPTRGGLVRALTWLHCFQNWPMKDLFSFIERFGMPFVIAKVDQNTWENERAVLHSLIRNFGPNGGGVFTKGTELELLSAANTGSDNVYFRTLEFCHNAIYTLLVGQLASSSDSSGMSNGTAQTQVRQDILEADARAVEATIRSGIAAPWTRFNYPAAAVPKLHFKVEPAEDLTTLATMVATLSGAGFKADETELSERFGMRLRYEAPAAPAMPGNAFAMSAEPEKTTGGELSAALDQWLKPLADELDSISGADNELSDEEFARRLQACADGKKSGSSEAFEKFVEGQIYEGFAKGATR